MLYMRKVTILCMVFICGIETIRLRMNENESPQHHTQWAAATPSPTPFSLFATLETTHILPDIDMRFPWGKEKQLLAK